MEIAAKLSPVLSLNVPEWFREASFQAWLNTKQPIMTWHEKGSKPNEWSDTIVFVDPNLSGDGSDDGVMPDKYWQSIVDICRDNFCPSTGFHVIVRLTNTQE